MSKPRLELKVGLFVLFCLALLAVLLLQFSKGTTLFRPVYTIVLDAGNVGGLRARAQVLMSGVQVGTVSQTVLLPQGTNVAIYLKIYSEYVIRDDAVFKIEASGFLGDQYVSIYPGSGVGAPLTNGAVAHAEEPFNLQEVARSTQGFVKRMDNTVKKLDDAISDVRRFTLNEKTLRDLSNSVQNLNKLSAEAMSAVDNINTLTYTNGPVGLAVSNLFSFSGQLTNVGREAQGILSNNAPQINSAISNIEVSAAMLTNLLGRIESGRGLAGAIVNNQKMADDFASLAGNLAVTTSNLNRLGFWHWIWYKPKLAETNAAPVWPADSTLKYPH